MYDVTRLLVMAGVPLALIVQQPDLGTSIIIVLVRGGDDGRRRRAAALHDASSRSPDPSVIVARGLPRPPGEATRSTGSSSFLHQNSTSPDSQALIYEVNNAKSAIGSGGLHGAGLFHGLQTVLGYVPEQRTDFIFTAIGEQLGFIGSVVDHRAARPSWPFGCSGSAETAKDTMGRLLCLGVFIFFAFSCFQNIGMTMGIMPVTGIPLPLLSYGGSAALVFFAAGGLVLSVSRRARQLAVASMSDADDLRATEPGPDAADRGAAAESFERRGRSATIARSVDRCLRPGRRRPPTCT